MVIYETSIFTKKISSLLNDEEYRNLQNNIVESPSLGNIIKNSGGIRKLSYKGSGRGKRGGTRIIYYWATSEEKIFMLYVYLKKDADNLTDDQLAKLKKLVISEFKNEK